MEMTYHTRRNVKRGILIGVSVFLALMLVWTCWIIWMERHIVYTRDGAVVDFQLTSQDPGEGHLAYPPAEQENVSIYYNDGEELIGLDLSLRQMKGYYITSDLLTNGDLGTIQAIIAALPVGSTVMIDVKNIKGHFFYTTEITDAPISTAVDVEAVDALIDDMLSRNLYVVATAPAFRDRSYGLAHTNTGLSFEGGGGALWLDSSNCYWLDPGKSRTMDYLSKIANELRLKGFDEVMFTDFCFPDSPQILFSGDKVEAIQTAAQTLVENCSNERFAVSFMATGSTVQPVDGRSRLYLTGVEAGDVPATAAKYAMKDPAAGLVFLTDSHDTRYESHCVLRPLAEVMPQ